MKLIPYGQRGVRTIFFFPEKMKPDSSYQRLTVIYGLLKVDREKSDYSVKDDSYAFISLEGKEAWKNNNAVPKSNDYRAVTNYECLVAHASMFPDHPRRNEFEVKTDVVIEPTPMESAPAKGG